MYDSILVPTDGSDIATTAAQAAFALVDRFDAELHTLNVLETNDRAYGEQLVGAVEEVANDLDIDPTTAVVDTDGAIHERILEYVRDQQIDCIVMGTHGQQNVRWFVLGSVAARTLRESPVPVITVHADTVITSEIETVLVPTDGSESARAATAEAIEFANATDASIHTVYVVNPDDVEGEHNDSIREAFEKTGQHAVDEAIEKASNAEVSGVEASVLRGVPHQAIADYVDDHEIDYVFMGTHGRTGVSRFMLGSVTERVVRQVPVPVVSVKATEPTD